jgi:uncharacterized protein (TIRG00374 family)
VVSLREEVATMDWWWVLVAVVTDILVYVWHGYRWSLLLSPIVPVNFWHTVRAIYVGLFANEVLPFRTGEVIRCYLISKWTHLPLSVSLSSALVERLFDGVWLMICLFVTVKFVPLPRYLVDGGTAIGILVLAIAVLLAAALFFKDGAKKLFARSRLLSKLNIVIDDLNIIGHSRYVYFSAFASLPYLLMQILPIYSLARGYGLDLSIGQAAALMVILRLGSVPPQAPGNVGTFQALAVVGLGLFGFDTALAKRFSVVMWGVITLPLLITGFCALAITGLKLAHIREQAHSSAKAHHNPQPQE